MNNNYTNFEMYTEFLQRATHDLMRNARVSNDMTAEQLDDAYFLLYCVEEQARNIRETLKRIEADKEW